MKEKEWKKMEKKEPIESMKYDTTHSLALWVRWADGRRASAEQLS